MPFDPNLQTGVSLTTVVSYEFKNIDIVASSCKYISGLNPSDNNDIPIINSNNPLVKTNPGPNGFIGLHVTNYMPPSPNNAFYPSSQHAYRCSDLYIYNNKITHNIVGIDNVLGEIVIKHNPVVSTDPILYLCFILKASTTGNDRPNEIDNVINFVTSTPDSANVLSTSINFSIPKQTLAYQYNNKIGNTIIVFCEAIGINTKSQDILKDFDSTGPTDDKLLPAWLVQNPTNAFKLVEQNITIGTDDNVYMECIPTGISKEDIKAYTVPINSQYTEEASKIEFMSSTVRFTFLVFFVLILYALFPTFWSTIYKIINPSEKADNETTEMRLKLDAVEFWYYVYLFCIFAVTFSLGLAFNFDSTHISIAFLIIFTLALTSTMILFNRTVKDPEHYLFKESLGEHGGWKEIVNYFFSLLPRTDPWFEIFMFWKNPALTGWILLVLIVAVNLIIIVIQHKGKLPSSINTNPKNQSGDPNVMNVLELLDCIFGSIFALIAIRVVYIIYKGLEPKKPVTTTAPL